MSTRSKLVYVAAVLAATPVIAQRPDYMSTVMTFQTSSPEKELGAQFADALRNRIDHDFNAKQLSVRKTVDVANYLESSGFSLTDPLGASDEQTLAQKLSADIYITGKIDHTPTGYRVEPYLTLTRDMNLRQPLPIQTSNKIDDAARKVGQSLRDAMKQLEGEKKCVSNYNTNKVREAILAANQGSAAYPTATLSRLCAQSVYLQLYEKAKTRPDSLAYADSALAAAAQVLHFDSLSTLPLQVNVRLFKVKGDTTHWRASLIKLVNANPTDTKLLGEVIYELASAGHIQETFPLVKSLLEKQPGDPEALKLAFLVYKNAGAWQEMANIGPELIRADTTVADSMYYKAMGRAYGELKQNPQAVEVLAEGTAKFPKTAGLWLTYGDALEAVGQMQQAQQARDTAIMLDSKLANLLFAKVKEYLDAKQYDSAYTAIQNAMTRGATASAASRYASGGASAAFRDGEATKEKDKPAAMALYQQSINFAQLANKLAPAASAQFLEGAAAFSLMQMAATDANTSKSCPMAETARDSYATALPALTAVAKGADSPFKSQAAKMLDYVGQFKPAIDSQLKHFCK